MENISKSETGRVRGPDWIRWLMHLRGKENINGLELGTFQGESAEWFLDNIFTHPTSKFICVDTFDGSIEHQVRQINCSKNEQISRNRLSPYSNVSIYKEYSNIFLAESKTKFNFIYVDAAHDAMNVLRDAVMGFEILLPGGIMIFDDYEWTDMPRDIDRPKVAIDAFAKCYSDQIEFVERGWQYTIRKK